MMTTSCVSPADTRAPHRRHAMWLSGAGGWLSGWLGLAAFWQAGSLLAQDKLDTLDKLPQPPAVRQESVSFAEVRKILRQLDSDQIAERDQAERRLIEIGPSVLGFLPEITSSTAGELKIRLQRIRAQLQNTKIESYFEPSLVSLSGQMQVSDALTQINQQTGNLLTLENPEAVSVGQVEMNADKQPFWEVLIDLMSQANLRINAFSRTDGLSLVPDNSILPGPEPAVSGPFLVSALSTQTSVQYIGRSDGQLDVSLQVAWEPRLKPVYLQLPMSQMKATLGENQLSSTNPQAAPEIPVHAGSPVTQIDLQFQRPPRSASKIDKLSGQFVAAIPSEKHKYIFEKFGNGKRQSETFGEVTVVLENARRNGSVYELRILAEFKAAQGALDSFRGWILSNEAYLLDASQNRLENVGLQTYAVTPQSVGVAFLFQINGDPNDYTLVYESPGMITRQTIQFELSDIDLP